jgi:hypothetical protein
MLLQIVNRVHRPKIDYVGFWATFRPRAMSDLSPEYAPKQTFANTCEFVGSRLVQSYSEQALAAGRCDVDQFAGMRSARH